jgi:LAO/AO transport system kinase
MPALSPQELLAGVQRGERRAIGKAVTLVESSRAEHRPDAEALLSALAPAAGRARRLGISGAPGVGKSTFIEAFGRHVVDQGHRCAVLAVDPSSARTGGSILGDRTRMEELSRDPRVFIRPSPAGATLGGVARRTREVMLVCEAAGFDVVLVETVGVGQSEVAVAGMVDGFVLLIPPGGGDELQGIKRGLIELADLVVVTKTDGELAATARRTAAEYQHAVRLHRPRSPAWTPKVLTVSALAGEGVGAVWDACRELHDRLVAAGELDDRRRAQNRDWLATELADALAARLRTDPRAGALLAELTPSVEAGTLLAPIAVRRVLDAFFGERRPALRGDGPP